MSQEFEFAPDGPQQLFRLADLKVVESAEVPVKAQGTMQQRVDAYRREIVEANLNFVRTFVAEEHWSDLAVPAASVDELDARYRTASGAPTFRGDLEGYRRNLFVPLDWTAVRRYGGWLAGTHFYFELTNSAGEPKTRAQALGDQKPSRRGQQLLRNAAVLADVAVGQLSLEHGDLIVPIAYAALITDPTNSLWCGQWEGAYLLKREAGDCNDAHEDTEQGRKRVKCCGAVCSALPLAFRSSRPA